MAKLDDFVLVQPSSPSVVGAGSGDDVYILSPHVIGSGASRKVTISDNDGANVIQLVKGLTISSSQLAGDFLVMTLSNGTEITVNGASGFFYEIAGDSLAGVEGVRQDFATFVAETLKTTIPADGETSEGLPNIVIGAEPEPTPEPEPEPEPQPGETLILGKGAEVIAPLAEGQEPEEGRLYTTAHDDVINAVVHSASSKRTLDSRDVIDGGDGNDTLQVDMQSNFSGFTGEGKLVNVETVNLTNSGTSARSFSGKGVEGVQTWEITGLVNLQDIAPAAVNLSHIAAGKTVNLDFTKATALDLGVHAVGSPDGLATVKSNASEVNLSVHSASGLNLNASKLTVSGEGDLGLAGANLKSVTASGEGALTFTAGSGLEVFDASGATGKVHIDATAASKARIATGSGDDRISVSADKLPVDVAIDGGDGWDTLIVKGMHTRTMQPTLTGIENLRYDGSAKLTLAADNIDGLESVNMASNGELVLSGLSGDLNLYLNGNGTVVSDHEGVTQLTVNKASTADVTLTHTASLDVQVNKDFTGSIKALGEISSLEVTANAAFSPTLLDIPKLEILTLTGSGSASLSGLQTAPALEVNAETLLGGLNLGKNAPITVDSLTVIGSHLGANYIEVGDVTDLIITGGIQDDTVYFKTVPSLAPDAIFDLDLGDVSSNDMVIFENVTDVGALKDILGKMNGVDKVMVGTGDLALSVTDLADLPGIILGTGVTLTIEGTAGDNVFDLSNIAWQSTPGQVIIKAAGGKSSIIGSGTAANNLVVDGPFTDLSISGGSGDDFVTIRTPFDSGMTISSLDLGAGTDQVLFENVVDQAAFKAATTNIKNVESVEQKGSGGLPDGSPLTLEGTPGNDTFNLNLYTWDGTPGQVTVKPAGGSDVVTGFTDIANDLVIDGPFTDLSISGGSGDDTITVKTPFDTGMSISSLDLGSGNDKVIFEKIADWSAFKAMLPGLEGENIFVTLPLAEVDELSDLTLGEHINLIVEGTNGDDIFDLSGITWAGDPGEVIIHTQGGSDKIAGTFGKLTCIGSDIDYNSITIDGPFTDLAVSSGKSAYVHIGTPFDTGMTISSLDLREFTQIYFENVINGDAFKAAIASADITGDISLDLRGTPKIAATDLEKFEDLSTDPDCLLTIECTAGNDVVDINKIDLCSNIHGLLITDFASGSDKIQYFQLVDKAGEELGPGQGVLVENACDFSVNLDGINTGEAVFNVSGIGDVAPGEGTNKAAVLEKIFGDSSSVARTSGYSGVEYAHFLFVVDDGTDSFLWEFWYQEDYDLAVDEFNLAFFGTITGLTGLAPGDVDLV